MTNNNNKFDKLKTKFYFRDVLKMGSLHNIVATKFLQVMLS